MNKKLKRYLDEEEKTEGRIAELQDYLKSIRAARKQEEDLEMVRSIRSLKLGGHELMELLSSIADSTITLVPGEEPETPEVKPEKEQKNDQNYESEDIKHEDEKMD